jgi:hypothetical protein
VLAARGCSSLSASTCLEIYKVPPAPSHTRETCEHKHLYTHILWLYIARPPKFIYTKLKSATSKPRVYMDGEPRAFGVHQNALSFFSLSLFHNIRETLAHILIMGYQISCVHVFKSERALCVRT